MDLMIQLLHKDLAIGKKSESYSQYIETRLSYSPQNTVSYRNCCKYLCEKMDMKYPTPLDSELDRILLETQIETEKINPEYGVKYHSLNFTQMIKHGLINEVIVGYDNDCKEDEVEQFLIKNGVVSKVLRSRVD
jgi:hypothetical protein